MIAEALLVVASTAGALCILLFATYLLQVQLKRRHARAVGFRAWLRHLVEAMTGL